MDNNRRIILKAMTVLGVTAGTLGCFNQPPGSGHELKSWLSQVQTNPELSSLVTQYPNAYKTLLERLSIDEKADSQEVQKAVKNGVVEDYAQGEHVVINQWHLSVTEALVLVSAIQIHGVTTEAEVVEKTFENAPVEAFALIENWGPRETYKGVKFNEQPDGHCGIWLVSPDIPDGVEVYLGGRKTKAFVSEKGLTTGIYQNVDTFINTVGETDIFLYDSINHKKQLVGSFVVLPAFTFHQYSDGTQSQVFGVLGRWGPKSTNVGEVFNRQPTGKAAFWFKINSMNSQIQLHFNEVTFTTTVSKGLITSAIDQQYIPNVPGEYPVELFSPADDERLLVGKMLVTEPANQ